MEASVIESRSVRQVEEARSTMLGVLETAFPKAIASKLLLQACQAVAGCSKSSFAEDVSFLLENRLVEYVEDGGDYLVKLNSFGRCAVVCMRTSKPPVSLSEYLAGHAKTAAAARAEQEEEIGPLSSDIWAQIRGVFVDRDKAAYQSLQRVLLLDKLRRLDDYYYNELLEAVRKAWEDRTPDSGNDDEIYVDGLLAGLDFVNTTADERVRVAS